MTRTAIYIDGFNLYFGIKSKGWNNCLWLDLCKLSDNLLKRDQQRVMCKYFTARISGNGSKQRRQNNYLEALHHSPGLDVFYGRYLYKDVTCRNCGNTYKKPEEKMTDVNIAVEMVKDAYNNLYDTAILISADSDLVPPIQIVKSLGKQVICAFPPRNNSTQLRNTANAHFTIGRANLYQSRLPNAIIKADGHILRPPDRWS